MHDHDLTTLLRMSHEAEAFERDLLLRVTATEPQPVAWWMERRRMVVRLAGWAAAACLAVAGVGVLVYTAGSESRTASVATLGESSRPNVAARADDARGSDTPEATAPAHADHDAIARGSVLIAMYRPDGGKDPSCEECWRAARLPPTWVAGCDVTSIGRDELLHALRRTGVAPAGNVVLVGLSGPSDSLPASDEQARTAALCLMRDAKRSDCVASAVDVRVHSWMR